MAVPVYHDRCHEQITLTITLTQEEGPRTLGTRVYFKSTDTHALLHKTFYHPKHTYKGIVKSQLSRYRRICTDEQDVEMATKVLFQALRLRGYSKRFLREIKKEVKQLFKDGFKPIIQEVRRLQAHCRI